MPAPQWTRTAPLFRSLFNQPSTFFDCSVRQLEIHGNVLLFGVHQGEYNVGQFGGDFEVLKPRCSSDDGFDVMLFDDLKVGGCIEVPQK